MSEPHGHDGRTKRVEGLEARIAESRQLRSLVRDPDLQAVEMERSRRRTLTGLWFFLALGLAFTTAGVHDFLAGDRSMTDPLWWAAWTVEPMFAGLLIVLLNFEATILAHGIDPDSRWWTRLKTVLLTSTLFMNVAPQLAPLVGAGNAAFNVGSLAVHAIIPVVVFALAEVIPIIQARARMVILNGYTTADHQAPPEPMPTVTAGTPPPSEHGPAEPEPEPELVREPEPVAAPEPEPSAPAAAAAVKAGSLKLPPQMVDKLQATREQVAQEGRELTTADVQRAMKVPDEMAARIVAEYTNHNGHALA